MAKILRLTKTSWADLWSRRRADTLALGAIALFFVAFVPQGLFLGHYLLANDAFFYNYPLRMAAWQMIRSGELPLWTPYILGGYPLLSMAQIGLGYPLTWGYAFLPGHVAEQIYVLAPFLLLPIFTYLYLREIDRSPLAALLGALTFGYGGMMASPLANNGLMPNSVMWMPLMLIGIERAYKSPLRALLLTTFAYSMSVLTGYGQGFVYIGIIAGAYALFLALVKWKLNSGLPALQRWRPVLIAAGAALFSMGIAAFQLLESARAVRRSIRRELEFNLFTQGSLSLWMLWKSFTTPIFYVIDMHAAVTPLAAVLAVVAVVWHARYRDKRDPRVFFWFVLAVIACVLMLGEFSPVYRVVYHIPLLNRFRVPSRHTFEWTFAAGVLAAYGFDIVRSLIEHKRATSKGTNALTLYASIALLILSCVVGVVWWVKSQTMQLNASVWPNAGTNYQLFKIAFAVLTAAALWRASLILSNSLRFGICLIAVLLMSFAEPSLLVARWWGGMSFKSTRFSVVTDATKFLQQYPPEQNRVYTRVFLMHEQFDIPPEFDSGNLNALHNIQNLAGYEPLILERYSRALGGVGLDAVATMQTGEPDDSLYSARSHVLDILNNTFTVSYVTFAPSFHSPVHTWTSDELTMLGDLTPNVTRSLPVRAMPADSLLLVTSLSNSVVVPQGTVVGKVRITIDDGSVVEHDLQAGRDTAEWAHDRPDVLAQIKHQLATPYDHTDVTEPISFRAYRYRTQLPLGALKKVKLIEITNVSPASNLALFGVALINSQTGKQVALAPPYSGFWKQVYEKENTIILHNERAMPRAWLVTTAEAVDGEEALRRIRGESQINFDPRQSVLLEVNPDELPKLGGGQLPADSGARIIDYKRNSLEIETNASEPTVLVVSEMFYPGWVATVDGQPQRILLADFLLRGISLPAGKHTISMRYTAPAARYGAIISIVTLIGLICLIVITYRRSPNARPTLTE